MYTVLYITLKCLLFYLGCLHVDLTYIGYSMSHYQKQDYLSDVSHVLCSIWCLIALECFVFTWFLESKLFNKSDIGYRLARNDDLI